MYPLVGDLAGEGIAVTVSCRVLGFSTTAYHAWKRDPVCRRDWDAAHLITAAGTSTRTTRSSATGSSPMS